MQNGDTTNRPLRGQDPHWGPFPALLGGLSGLTALVVAIGAGLWADNDAGTILLRGLLAMAFCWTAGFIAGWLVRGAVHADRGSDCAEDLGLSALSDDSLQTEETAEEAREHREAA
ncbi:MAG: hypothetical protein CMJ29_09065 [Phycisphaerae bacterium]|nr:hypothetical protein [Phycisphaerae bacterium]